MRRFRPNDLPAVAPGYNEKTSPGCRRTVVTRPKWPVIDLITEILELGFPSLEGHALAAGTGQVVHEWAPVLEFLNVLQNDDIGLCDPGDLENDPCEAPDILLDRLPALRLTEVFAIG